MHLAALIRRVLASACALVQLCAAPAEPLVTVTSSAQSNADSFASGVSDDGRFVLFTSTAHSFTANDGNGTARDLFLFDRSSKQVQLVSVNTNGFSANQPSINGSISGNGRYVVFESLATDLSPNETNRFTDVFVRDLVEQRTIHISKGPVRTDFGDRPSENPSITPDGQFVLFESASSKPSFAFPHLTKMKSLAQLASYEVRHWSNTAEREQAVQSAIASLMLARSMRNESILIGHLVRLALSRISVFNLEYLLSKQQLTTDDLERLDMVLADSETDNKQATFRALVGERAYALSSFKNDADNLQQILGWNAGLSAKIRTKGYQLLGFGKRDLRIYLDTMRALAAAAEQPFPEAYQLSVAAGAEANRRLSTPLGRLALLSGVSIPPNVDAIRNAAVHATLLRCARTAIAIEKYRVDHDGRAPEALEQLVPRYLPEPPLDAIEGKPIAYALLKSSNGYKLSGAASSAVALKRTAEFTVYR